MNVNKNHQSFQGRPEQTGSRNLFDLSYPWIGSFTMGKLIPFFIKETMPNDYWKISSEVFLRFAPMYLPIMGKMNMSISYFFVPNRIIWPGTKQDSWEWFIRDEASVEAPYLMLDTRYLTDSGQKPTTIAEYMGIPSMQTEADDSIDSFKISALPFSAILKIWDEYFRNDQIQGAKWFELTGGDNTTGLEAAFPVVDYGVGLQIKLLPLLRNWQRDYYTSATPSPQVGSNVLVPIMRNDSVDIGNYSYLGPTRWMNISNNLPAADGDLQINGGGPAGPGGTYNDTGHVYLDIQETSASIRDLRYAIMLTEYLERLMRVGDRYRDFIKGFWRVDPFPMLVDRPAYLGGKRGKVVVSEVLSHAETDTMPVGSYAGQMIALDNSGDANYHCMEHGFVIGLISVFPDTFYFQGLHRMWTRETKYDYPWEQFALIGDDALYHKEVMFNFLDAEQVWNEGIFGYLPRYSDWRYSNAVVAGQMRDSEGPLFSFHLGRFLDPNDTTETALNSQFLECAPAKERVFQLSGPNEEEIYGYIWNDVTVLRQLPKFGIPAL